MKVKLDIAALICQGIAIVLLFIPGMFYWEHWEAEGYGMSKLSYRASVSFMHATGNCVEILGYVVLLLMIVSIVVLLMDIFNKSFKYKEILLIAVPLITVILMIIIAIVCGIRDEYGYGAPINWLYYFEMLILAAVVVISFLRKKSNSIFPAKAERAFEGGTHQQNSSEAFGGKINGNASENDSNSNFSVADEIKKYKELFDAGTITQEEFDAKKKQLLGL